MDCGTGEASAIPALAKRGKHPIRLAGELVRLPRIRSWTRTSSLSTLLQWHTPLLPALVTRHLGRSERREATEVYGICGRFGRGQ